MDAAPKSGLHGDHGSRHGHDRLPSLDRRQSRDDDRRVIAGAGVPARTSIRRASRPRRGRHDGRPPVYSDATLSTPTGDQLATGTPLRVAQVAAPVTPPGGSGPVPAVQVSTLDGATTGWVGGNGLAPRDSVGPNLWSLDGVTTITPNFDGANDSLNLLARFSEPVAWTAKILDAGSTVVASLAGSGDSAVLGWNPVVAGAAPPTADYTWSLHATDGWGNTGLDTGGVIHLVSGTVPPSGVLSFAPITAATTNGLTSTYGITFAGPVSGPLGGRFHDHRIGLRMRCRRADWHRRELHGRRERLHHRQDRPDPGAGIHPRRRRQRPGRRDQRPLRPVRPLGPGTRRPEGRAAGRRRDLGRQVAGPRHLDLTDPGGAGIRSYDIAQSSDGGAFATIRSALPGASLALSLAPGHSYRFEVRATDKANNRSGWVAGSAISPQLVEQTATGVAAHFSKWW